MECSSMVSIVAFGPGDPGSIPAWFAVSLLDGDKKPLKEKWCHCVGIKIKIGDFLQGKIIQMKQLC